MNKSWCLPGRMIEIFCMIGCFCLLHWVSYLYYQEPLGCWHWRCKCLQPERVRLFIKQRLLQFPNLPFGRVHPLTPGPRDILHSRRDPSFKWFLLYLLFLSVYVIMLCLNRAWYHCVWSLIVYSKSGQDSQIFSSISLVIYLPLVSHSQ